MSLDPNTPVIVGIGQVSDPLDAPDYHAWSAVELAAEAARAALADAGWTQPVDAVAAVRAADISAPNTFGLIGRSDNVPRSVADRLGIDPEVAIQSTAGGQSPQAMLSELAERIATGELTSALLIGSEATLTAIHSATQEPRPDHSEARGGQLDDRGWGLAGLTTQHLVLHGLTDTISQYTFFDNARRARLGLSLEEYRLAEAELLTALSLTAASNPHSFFNEPVSASDLAAITETNRLVSDLYTKQMVAREKVNLGAAVLLCSYQDALEAAIPPGRMVFLHGRSTLTEKPLMERPDLSTSPAAARALDTALTQAGVSAAQIHAWDLYSCFPIALFTARESLGIEPTDPRGLTLTGGLPFFGGPGNNYSLHGIAEAVSSARATPGSRALVWANGGLLSKHAVGVYCTEPRQFPADLSPAVQSTLDAVPSTRIEYRPQGTAVIETYAVTYPRSGRYAAVIAKDVAGHRFVANPGDDERLWEHLEAGTAIGLTVAVRSHGSGNTVASNSARLAELFPQTPPRLRISDEVLTAVDGHVLEITINRPEVRNALTPQTNAILDEVIDAYLADDSLWCAIITGAGDRAFCAGNDLAYTATGKPLWFPHNGFAGLTARRGRHKPIIAAVNGAAYGGGFEIAMACDLVVADPGAKFALPEVKVGLIAAMGGLVRLPRLLPRATALDLILTGRSMSAQEALGHGLISRLSRPGEALAEARELATQIVNNSPTGVRLSLKSIEEADEHANPAEALVAESEILDELLLSEDTLIGVLAFLTKQQAGWVNR